MSTIHSLRRRAGWSLSELAAHSGIPLRRLAEYEYTGVALTPADRARLASCFGIESWGLAGGWSTAAPAPVTGFTPPQAQVLVGLAAITTLALGLRTGAATINTSLAALAPLPPAPAALQPQLGPTATAQLAPPTGLPTLVPTAKPTPPTQVRPTATPAPTATARPMVVWPTVPPPAPVRVMHNDPRPHSCPLLEANGIVVVTQGYGVGTHAPAATMGAVDLAIDGNGDGIADIASSRGVLVVAAHSGTVTVQLATWPAGNHIWVDGSEEWRTGYSHLAEVFVKTGDHVQAGQPLGTVGETGEAYGPHLDFQVWHQRINRDPSEYVLCAAYNHAPLVGNDLHMAAQPINTAAPTTSQP